MHATRLAIVLSVLLVGACAKNHVFRFSDDQDVECFRATASPKQSVPPINAWNESRAPYGEFYLAINTTSGDAAFLQLAKRVEQLTMTHLHQGNSSTNGPVLLPLTPGTPVINNTLPQFVPPLTIGEGGRLEVYAVIPDTLLTGPLNGLDFIDLMELAMEGNVYVNYHTVAYPAGVMRGQLRTYRCSGSEMKELTSWSA